MRLGQVAGAVGTVLAVIFVMNLFFAANAVVEDPDDPVAVEKLANAMVPGWIKAVVFFAGLGTLGALVAAGIVLYQAR